MQVKFDNKIIEFKGRRMVEKILKELRVNREEVIIIKDNNLITEKDWVEDEEEIEILRIAQGG